MRRTTLLWLAAIAVLTVVVAVQVLMAAGEREVAAQAAGDPPTVEPGTDVLAGIAVVPTRIRGFDYHRAAFGDAWDDFNDAPGGRNGCDTRFLGGFGMLRETLQEVGFKQGTLR